MNKISAKYSDIVGAKDIKILELEADILEASKMN